jgi:hypothetical protein
LQKRPLSIPRLLTTLSRILISAIFSTPVLARSCKKAKRNPCLGRDSFRISVWLVSVVYEFWFSKALFRVASRSFTPSF